jgi:hypothetical protein
LKPQNFGLFNEASRTSGVIFSIEAPDILH